MAQKVLEAAQADLDLVLLGKSGSGKRATGNSILEQKVFNVSSIHQTKTAALSSHCKKQDNLWIRVVDPPDLTGTGLIEKGDEQKITEAISQLFMDCDADVHLFLLIVRLDERLTQEDTDILMTFGGIFGKNYLKNHGILVVTHGDSFEAMMDETKRNMTFEEWISQANLEHLGQLIKECHYRCVLFDNKTKDEKTKGEQLRKLFKFAVQLKQEDNGNEEFERKRKKRMAENKMLQLEPEIKGKIQKLISRAEKLKHDYVDHVEGIENSAKQLLGEIKEESRGSSMLKEHERQVEYICQECENVKTQIKEYKMQEPGHPIKSMRSCIII